MLGRLELLHLEYNEIGDEGMTTLASVIASGVLPACRAIVLDGNPGDPTPVQEALAAHLQPAVKTMAITASRQMPAYLTPTAGGQHRADVRRRSSVGRSRVIANAVVIR